MVEAHAPGVVVEAQVAEGKGGAASVFPAKEAERKEVEREAEREVEREAEKKTLVSL